MPSALQTNKPKYHELYAPSAQTRQVISDVYARFLIMNQVRSRSYRYFNDRIPTTYWDDSMKRWNGYIPPREDGTADWQARTFNNLTRNVTISFLSGAAMNPPKMKWKATDPEGQADKTRALVMDRLYAFSQEYEDAKWKFFISALDTVTKGTTVTYEGYKQEKTKVRDIIKFNWQTGEVKTKEDIAVTYDGCFRETVQLDQFYVSNAWVSDIQLQPDVIWLQSLKYADAKSQYGKYPDWNKVVQGSYPIVVSNIPFFKQGLYFNELEDDRVQVLRYYNRFDDKLCIIANGILLYDGPLPFAHKKLPFSKAIFEPFDSDFFWGKSLPDKIMNDQDVINTLTNMMLDQTYLSIFKPILTDDPDEIEETILVPGLIKKVNSIASYKVLNELTGPEASHFNMLQMMMRFAQDNAGPQTGGGGASSPRGGKVSARQAMFADEAARKVLGLNIYMLEKHELECAKLRGANLLQFVATPKNTLKVTGVKPNDFLAVFKVDGAMLSDGSYGTSVLRVAPSEQKLPTSYDLTIEEEAAAMRGENLEVHAVTADYIRSICWDVEVVPESSYQQSESIKRAEDEEFYKIGQLDPNFDKVELSRDLAIMFKRDPNKYVKPQQKMQNMQDAAMQGMAAKGKGPLTPMADQINGAGAPSLSNIVGQ